MNPNQLSGINSKNIHLNRLLGKKKWTLFARLVKSSVLVGDHKVYIFFYSDSFQKILQNLPEKIYNRWQFHSIGKSRSISDPM